VCSSESGCGNDVKDLLSILLTHQQLKCATKSRSVQNTQPVCVSMLCYDSSLATCGVFVPSVQLNGIFCLNEYPGQCYSLVLLCRREWLTLSEYGAGIHM
jgi:hypothetical protein